MAYTEDIERMTQYARNAMERMAAEGLMPHPENFTLWYGYYSGHFPELTRALDRLLGAGHTLTEEVCTDLYRRFLSIEAETRAIRENSERTQTMLGRLVDILESAGLRAGQYGEALDGFQGRLAEGAGDAEQLRVMIGAIATATRLIADEHGRLQNQLADSAQQLVELRQNLDSARREAMTDGLTGIANRKAFDLSLNSAADEAAERGKPLSLLMLDIDHFKKFNDQHGHQLGDHVLRLVARVLKECIKGRDIAARFGGEEFAIILPQTRLANAVGLAEHIRINVGSRQIVNRFKREQYGAVTLSIGVTEYRPGEDLAEFIKRADGALYMAKNSGRNRVCSDPVVITAS